MNAKSSKGKADYLSRSNGSERSKSKSSKRGKTNGMGPKNSRFENKFNSTANQRRAKEIEDTARKCGRTMENDFAWYNKYPLYTEYAGTLAFGKPIGETFNLTTSNTPSAITGLKQVIPGIMGLYFIPTPGYSADRNSPLNRSAIRWYSALRKMQKASGDYDSQDAMMLNLAVDSLAMFHEIGKRIVGIANMNSVLNRYVPEGLLTAMGVDPIDVRNNLADWWGYVNKFAIDASNVTMPKDLELRTRHSWMCDGIYTDGTTERAQIYMFMPLGFWQYSNTATVGTTLEWVPWPSLSRAITDQTKLVKLADYKKIGNTLLSRIFGDEDAGTISGDTYNAIGAANCITYDQIDRNYTMTALYSEEVLSQIENAQAAGYSFATGYTPVITQNPSVNNGAILFTPQFEGTASGASKLRMKKTLVNMHWEKPDVKSIIEATRLRCGVNAPVTGGKMLPTAFGSEIVQFYKIWTSTVDNPQVFTDTLGFTNDIDVSLGGLANQPGIKEVYRQIAKLSAFDWHPIIYFWMSTTQDIPDAELIGAFVDYDVCAILEDDKLAEMHEAALTSEFDIPESFLR